MLNHAHVEASLEAHGWTLDMVAELAEASMAASAYYEPEGVCLACGGTVPADSEAEDAYCDLCGTHAVLGAEQALLYLQP